GVERGGRDHPAEHADPAVGPGAALGERGQVGAEEDRDHGGGEDRLRPVVHVPGAPLGAAGARLVGGGGHGGRGGGGQRGASLVWGERSLRGGGLRRREGGGGGGPQPPVGQDAAQGGHVVGDDAVHPHVQQACHQRGVVDGPHVHLQAQAVRGRHQVPGDQGEPPVPQRDLHAGDVAA